MLLMLRQEQPDDYVVATGEAHSVRDFVVAAFGHAGLDWQSHVEIDPRYYRPAEVDFLVGDAEKAKTKLGWVPKTTFGELVHLMVDADVARLGSRKEKSMRWASKRVASAWRSSSPLARCAHTPSSHRFRSKKKTSGMATRRRPTRHTAWRRRCSWCKRRPIARSTASTRFSCSR